MKDLMRVLKKTGKPVQVMHTPDGTRVLLLGHGGRALGLFAPDSEENFYWTHSALDSVTTARQFYGSNKWHNSGGDRTWLSPEADLFFPHFPRLDSYFQQRSLDPGRYRLGHTRGGLQFTNRLTVQFSRSGRKAHLKITKKFGPALNPLRHERGLNLKAVEYAGYTQCTTLELMGNSRQTHEQVGLWNLIQMPHGGDLLIPTFGRAQIRPIFSTEGNIPAKDLITTDHLIRYRMQQKGEHKISIRVVSVCGRIGYLYRRGGRWDLIIRNFAVNPSGEYVDVPWTDTKHFGFGVQACNVNSQLGAFSELEYHVPAIGHGTGATECEDVAQVWAFRGSRTQIESIARILLTPEPWPKEAS